MPSLSSGLHSIFSQYFFPACFSAQAEHPLWISPSCRALPHLSQAAVEEEGASDPVVCCLEGGPCSRDTIPARCWADSTGWKWPLGSYSFSSGGPAYHSSFCRAAELLTAMAWSYWQLFCTFHGMCRANEPRRSGVQVWNWASTTSGTSYLHLSLIHVPVQKESFPFTSEGGWKH